MGRVFGWTDRRSHVAQLISQAQNLAAQAPVASDPSSYLEEWAPVIDLVVAAARGDQTAKATLTPLIDQLAANPDWAALVAVLRRILAGERDQPALLANLDDIDTAITTHTLHQLRDG